MAGLQTQIQSALDALRDAIDPAIAMLRARGKQRSRWGRTGQQRRPCQPSEPDAQLETASWRGIEMSGDGDSRVVVLHCCLC